MNQVVLFNVFNGLIVWAFYALMALGLSLILNLSGVINFAHGGFLALGAYLAYTLIPYIGFWGALIVAPPLTAVLGLVVERLLIRPPSVTGVVDRLERGGLVERGGSPTDLRAKRVSLTPRGRQLVERVLQNLGRQVDRVMGVLTTEEQAELHRLLSRLGEHLEGLSAHAMAGE